MSDRVRVRRVPDRGIYRRQVIYDILDVGFVCHLGFAVDGQPYVVPTLYGRKGDQLVLHGSAASRALQAAGVVPVCVTVTHLDGLVAARSLFNHSANYRSVMVLGQAERVDDPAEKEAALYILAEHLFPGRWGEARRPSPRELRATVVLRLDLREASAKVRAGPPSDDEEDLELAVWAGELPMSLTSGPPLPDPRLPPGIEIPQSIRTLVADIEKGLRR